MGRQVKGPWTKPPCGRIILFPIPLDLCDPNMLSQRMERGVKKWKFVGAAVSAVMSFLLSSTTNNMGNLLKL
jgi:hypothetical protein